MPEEKMVLQFEKVERNGK